MTLFEKPTVRYGWVRGVAWTVLAGVLAWTLAAAGLRAAGEVPWMAWSGYQTFSLLEGVELALVALLAAILAGWLEEQEHAKLAELTRLQEAERALAVHREAVIGRFRSALREMLPDTGPEQADLSAEAWMKLAGLAREALQELDGKGRGELLLFLYAHKLVTAEKPAIDLNGADCRGALLNGADLTGIHLEGADLSSAQMNAANLGQARLSGANLGRAFLRETDLQDAVLSKCNLRAARLDGANLQGAECSPESLESAVAIGTIYPDGRKVTNEHGKQYMRDKELSIVVDRL